MNTSKESNALRKLNRREIVRLAGLSAAGATILAGDASAFVPSSPDTPCCGTQPLPKDSVFTTVCDDSSKKKYGDGDNDVTYRLAALWLLLTTENWEGYRRDGATEDQWIAGLHAELGIPMEDVKALWDESRSKADAEHFSAVRAFWKNFTSDQDRYGKRPCIGGKTALDIACLATTAHSIKTKPRQ